MRDGLHYAANPSGVTVTGKCVFCSKHNVVKMSPSEYSAFNFSDVLIQDALPNHSADDREFLLSGICPKCFPKDDGG